MLRQGRIREDRLATLADLLVKHSVGLIKFHQARGTEDHEDGVGLGEVLLASVDSGAEILGRTRGKDIYGVVDGRTRQEVGLQTIGTLTLVGGDVHATLGEGVGQHHARTTSMGDDGEVVEFRMSHLAELGVLLQHPEDATHGRQFLTAIAADDTSLAEECINGRVAGRDGSRMGRGGTRTAGRTAGLDGGDAAALADEVAGVEQELVGVGDVLDIKELDAGVVLGIEVLVHILEHVLDADLLAVADTPYGVELQTLLDGRLPG